MDREFMSNEENYYFDVAGYLIVRNAMEKLVNIFSLVLEQAERYNLDKE